MATSMKYNSKKHANTIKLGILATKKDLTPRIAQIYNISLLSGEMNQTSMTTMKRSLRSKRILESDVDALWSSLREEKNFVGMYNIIMNLIMIFDVSPDQLDRAFSRRINNLSSTIPEQSQSGGLTGVEHYIVKILLELCIDLLCSIPSEVAGIRLKHSAISSNRVDSQALKALTEQAIRRFPSTIQNAQIDPYKVPMLRRVLRTEYDAPIGYVDPNKLHFYLERHTNAVRKSDGFIIYTVGDLVFDILMNTGLSQIKVENLFIEKTSRKATIKEKIKTLFKSKSNRIVHSTIEYSNSGNKEQKSNLKSEVSKTIENPLYNSALSSSDISSISSRTYKSRDTPMKSPFDTI